jgi:hypothetical protein
MTKFVVSQRASFRLLFKSIEDEPFVLDVNLEQKSSSLRKEPCQTNDGGLLKKYW